MPKNIINKSIAIITKEMFMEGWKKMKEKISSSISSIHFGYLKAYALDQELASFKTAICNIPYLTGYSPKDWCKVINIMIEKKGKRNLVQDLQTINLIEVEFNFNNKILVKEVM